MRTAHARTYTHTRHEQPVPPTTHPQMAAATGLCSVERRSSRRSLENVRREPRGVGVASGVGGVGDRRTAGARNGFFLVSLAAAHRPRMRTVQYYYRRAIIIVR